MGVSGYFSPKGGSCQLFNIRCIKRVMFPTSVKKNCYIHLHLDMLHLYLCISIRGQPRTLVK